MMWFNDAQKEIVKDYPRANSINVTIPLVAGTRQSIPISYLELIDCVRNMTGVGLTTPGKVITKTQRSTLDETDRNWHAGAAAADGQIDHFIFDDRDPTHFYVFPPSDGINGAEAVCSSPPAAVTLVTDVLSIPDIYSNVMVDYMLYRLYSKDTEVGSADRAVAFYNAYRSGLGAKGAADQVTISNQRA